MVQMSRTLTVSRHPTLALAISCEREGAVAQQAKQPATCPALQQRRAGARARKFPSQCTQGPNYWQSGATRRNHTCFEQNPLEGIDHGNSARWYADVQADASVSVWNRRS